MNNHQDPDRLWGIIQIQAYYGKNWRTIQWLISEHGFPARKIGGEWSSSKAKIDEWHRKFIECQDTKS